MQERHSERMYTEQITFLGAPRHKIKLAQLAQRTRRSMAQVLRLLIETATVEQLARIGLAYDLSQYTVNGTEEESDG